MDESVSAKDAIRAVGIVGDGMAHAMGIIASILACRCGVRSEVEKDLKRALQMLLSAKAPPAESVITQQILQEALKYVQGQKKRGAAQ